MEMVAGQCQCKEQRKRWGSGIAPHLEGGQRRKEQPKVTGRATGATPHSTPAGDTSVPSTAPGTGEGMV